MSCLSRLTDIAENDVHVLEEKEREYGGSWKKRGGVGAFMMMARKWDRIENAMDRDIFTGKVHVERVVGGTSKPLKVMGSPDRFDIFERALMDGREEGILDDIGDLRRYLLLVEAEIRELRWSKKEGEQDVR